MLIACNECKVHVYLYYNCVDCPCYDCCDLCYEKRSELSHDKSHRLVRVTTVISSGESNGHNYSIQSDLGYTLEFHPDGNLYIYKRDVKDGTRSEYLWESGTKGTSSDTLRNNQGDMQLSLNGEIVWEKTKDTEGILVELEHDALVSHNGLIFWRSDNKDYGPNIGLKTPKRLFDMKLMKTVLYEDAVGVEKEGYVAISHVWGSQRKYVPKGVGVTDGVTWTIPLSDPEKIQRAKDAMLQYGERYCWFDILCLPQNKQDEVNLEIPFMGDYYAGADMVLVLATVDPVISDEFTKWDDIMEDVMKENRDFTDEERNYIMSRGVSPDLFDISGEKWFTRLWTFQEAVMAKKLVLVCSDRSLDLFRVGEKILKMVALNNGSYIFKSGTIIGNLLAGKQNRLGKNINLLQVMNGCSRRDCFKPQDKFYGALGVLEYKDFPVDYDINMEELNRKIIQYAYSKGDVSWLAVGGDIGSGFIQPMDRPFEYVGWAWKEDIPGICKIRLEDEIMYINAWSFAKVVCCEKIDTGVEITTNNIYKIFKSWNMDIKDVIKNLMQFVKISDDEMEVCEALLELILTDNQESLRNVIEKISPDAVRNHIGSSHDKIGIVNGKKDVTAIKATTWENKDIPLIVIGEASIGDQIMLVRIKDTITPGVLGIVVDKYFRRKGVCLCEKIEMTEKEAISRYTPQEFPL